MAMREVSKLEALTLPVDNNRNQRDLSITEQERQLIMRARSDWEVGQVLGIIRKEKMVKNIERSLPGLAEGLEEMDEEARKLDLDLAKILESI